MGLCNTGMPLRLREGPVPGPALAQSPSPAASRCLGLGFTPLPAAGTSSYPLPAPFLPEPGRQRYPPALASHSTLGQARQSGRRTRRSRHLRPGQRGKGLCVLPLGPFVLLCPPSLATPGPLLRDHALRFLPEKSEGLLAPPPVQRLTDS